MTCIIDAKSNRHLSARLAAGLAISTFLVLGTFVVSASAEERGEYHHHGHHGYGGGYDGRYYPTPPIVYGSPYYYPPPVVYGPGLGLYLPGLSIRVR